MIVARDPRERGIGQPLRRRALGNQPGIIEQPLADQRFHIGLGTQHIFLGPRHGLGQRAGTALHRL